MTRDYSAELQALMPEVYSVLNRLVRIVGDSKIELDSLRAKAKEDEHGPGQHQQ